ncbi:MAG: noncanonical pyrimidine nucleotidase, YjjG family [Saprospiraceae bacterium]|nr:YjjG family noncanonical pyrimidine nucleotidase [Bacteroidia bacterium]NNE15312.1 noncanonical pyrimidine nucleotidase, YjjG family [Saprospiraceae bacterium]NNL93956.1 noncanonical pyrimidine nucleotidase, YjjG family [Saprospiraceae bacterium]
MKNFDWLLFDLDNTILDFDKSSKEAFKSLINHIDNSLDAHNLYPIYHEINLEYWEKREAGKISHTELKWKRWHDFFDAHAIDFDPHHSNDLYFEGIKENPFFVDHADTLLNEIQDHEMMIITNGLSEVQRPRIEAKRLQDFFEHIVISDEINVAKPQSGFFEHCHDLIDNHQKDRVLVIGDTLKSDILGGNNFGFKTCWYNHYDKPNNSGIEPDFSIHSIKDLKEII